MNIKFHNISYSLNKAYLKQDITKADFLEFKNALELFFKNYNPNESEEHQKNNIAEFLKNAFYKNSNLINTKDRIDLAIYNGVNINDSVGVLIEVKATKNKNEMFSQSNPNSKALQEIISYYLKESITLKNKDIKNIIITNSEDWFLFDAAEFERAFYKNRFLIDKFSQHKEELFGATTTDWFYKFLHDDIIPKIEELNVAHFNLMSYRDNFNDEQFIDELILLFKILSPEHLLKKPFANDSNTLDIQFYDELLHLLGLEEVKDSGKKILLRLPPSKRNDGSFIENTIRILEINHSLNNVSNLNEFGANKDEQLFSIALELCITWLNRILFLKLLESQLIKFNNNNYDFKFLTIDFLKDFDELNELFFEALAIKPSDRLNHDEQRFSKIPYLNSSLFEQTKLEKQTLLISALKDRYTIPIFHKTVLKTLNGDKRSGNMKFQEYLFDFLDAYNFASVAKAAIQENNKTIINSSVLGLIFEKLNGYKDGSFFTPGFITMYMCRETISLAVVNKFNERYNWACKTLTDVFNKLESSTEKLIEYNNVVNSIRLVDPAVGSGHFLVSALNEFINIKAELAILIDKDGKRLKDYKFFVENDELIIIDSDDKVFSYLSPEIISGAKRDELQRIQKTIFHEKQNIIENCLFGVDINQKSVSISRLRLWIELLKFMYYKKSDNNNYELETLPNIDINIKVGNSIISKIPIDDTVSRKVADEKVIPLYKNAVKRYKNVYNHDDKMKIIIEIENYKTQLKGLINEKSNSMFMLNKKKAELNSLIMQKPLFDEQRSKKQEKEYNDKINKLTSEIDNLNTIIEDLKNNPIYTNAFEWRFEFPEVLDNNTGDFLGFDVVIGNPPYIQLQKDAGRLSDMLEKLNYKTFVRTGDIYALFYERGWQILKQGGVLTFITSNKWMRAGYGEKLRDFLSKNSNPLQLVDFGGYKVFDSATVDTNVLMFEKRHNSMNCKATTIAADYIKDSDISSYIKINSSLMGFNSSSQWVIMSNIERNIKDKIEQKGIPLKDWDVNIYYGIKTGYNEAFIIDGKKKDELIAEDERSAEIIKPILRGRDIKRYKAEFADLWLIDTHNGYKSKKGNIVAPVNINNYKAIKKHLDKYYNKLEVRQDKGKTPYNLRNCAYYEEFEKEKIIWKRIGSVLRFQYDNIGALCLDSTCILTSNQEDIKYLLALMNTNISYYYLINNSPKTGTGDVITSVQAIEPLLIPKLTEKEQKPFIELVDKILAKKELNQDTSTEEKEIDRLVYELYELTEEEIKYIENI